MDTNELIRALQAKAAEAREKSRLGSYDHIRHREQGRALAFQEVIELLKVAR